MSAIQLSMLAVKACLSSGSAMVLREVEPISSRPDKKNNMPTTTTKPSKPAFHKPFGGLAGPPPDSHKQHPLRNHLVAASGEFVGTFLFLLFAFLGHSTAIYEGPRSSTSSSNQTSQPSQPSNETVVYIALSYGFSFLVCAWIMYRISGGLFNPAVTFALVLVGAVPWKRGLIFFPVQLLSAMSAAAVVKVIIPGDIANVQTTLAPGINVAQGLFLEMFLTSLLIFAVLMLAVEKSRATFMGPVGIGLALFVAELAGIGYTGASLNPVRSFAPCVASADFPHYHWIYWVGPVLGGLISGGYYHFVRYFNYWEANPGQDSSGGGWTPPTSIVLDAHLPMQQTEVVGPTTPRHRREEVRHRRRRSQTTSRGREGHRSDQYPHQQYKQSWEEAGGENQYDRAPHVEEATPAHRKGRFDRAEEYDAGYSSADTGMGLRQSRHVRIRHNLHPDEYPDRV